MPEPYTKRYDLIDLILFLLCVAVASGVAALLGYWFRGMI